jgi:hypothetical protein
MSMNAKRICTFFVFIIASTCLMAAPAPANDGAMQERPLQSASGNRTMGIVFNAGDTLGEIESYQMGIGIKYGSFDDLRYRGLADITYSGSTDSFQAIVGLALEKHFLPEPISPYYGAFANVGWEKSGTISDIPLSIGAMIGAEVFALDFLSFFAEYCVAADMRIGLGESKSFDYLIGTRMGNDAKIGVVVYFEKARR